MSGVSPPAHAIAGEDAGGKAGAAAHGSEALTDPHRRLEAAVRAGRLGVHEFHPDSGFIHWDQTVRALWGLEPHQTPTYDLFRDAVLPEDRDAMQAAVDASLDPARAGPGGTGRYECEYRVRNRRTGEVRWIRADGDVSFRDGRAVLMIGTVKDISDQKALEESNRLLMRELDHRVRNMLSVVHALASLGLKSGTDIDSARDAFLGRLKALAAAQEDLAAERWQAAELHGLLARILAPADLRAGRFVLEGPCVCLDARRAQALTLILHELSTNALKHGALSVPGGRVAISWTLRPDAPLVDLTWAEAGGPPVAKPLRKGFGTTLIQTALAPDGGGRVELEHRAEGLRCRISAPVEGASDRA